MISELIEPSDLPPFAATAFVAEIDGGKTPSLRSFYPRLVKALALSDHFGKNLDALFASLTSLEHLGSSEAILVIRHAGQFLEKENPARREIAMEVLRDAQLPENRYDAVKFRVLLVR
jgi:RNAse (barnase) inhibitor barstar